MPYKATFKALKMREAGNHRKPHREAYPESTQHGDGNQAIAEKWAQPSGPADGDSENFHR